MKVNPYIFRGYDLRGVVGVDLSAEVAEHIGRAYGTYLRRRGITELVVGRDSRASGPAYSEALIKGLLSTGADVVDIGTSLIGTFYWSQYFLNRRGGVYVSASHNPPEYNGFKFANGFSETLVSDGMQELRKMVESEDYEQNAGGKVVYQDILPDYNKEMLKRVTLSKEIKIVVDPSCTTAGAIAPNILRAAGCEVIEKNCNVDSSFPLGLADPTSSSVLERLGQEVKEVKADLGVSYDADGDRIGIVDENGGIIWNDVLLQLFSLDVLGRHAGTTIMYNVLCSQGVPETILQAGGTPFMWRVGHSFLKKKNQEVGAAFIGELSGHFFFSKDFYNHDDGIYSTLRLLSYLGRVGKRLSEVVAVLPKYISSPEVKISCADDKKVEITSRLKEFLMNKYPDAEVIDDERVGDGVRLNLPEGMLIVRYSQNGPYLTIKFESKKEEQYQELRDSLAGLLHTFPEIDWTSSINLNLNAFEKE
jgi:phosphomannomutase / phosphoglucomutase